MIKWIWRPMLLCDNVYYWRSIISTNYVRVNCTSHIAEVIGHIPESLALNQSLLIPKNWMFI